MIPAISAFVGWGTNVVAVKMMFYPLDFFGIRPYLGWQGIVPRHARALAGRSTELITTKLIKLSSLFEDFDAHGFAGHVHGPIGDLVDQIVADIAGRFAPKMWDSLDESARDQVRGAVRDEIETVTVGILDDMGDAIEDIVDLKATVMDVAERDRALIGEMFQTVGVEEFKFIRRSGAYFGFAFGIIQMLAWVGYPAWWVLPFFGFFVGYATNWLALKLIFEPAEPRKLGPIEVQGLFHKRQHAVAKEFATLVSRDVLNPENMVAKMVSGETGERFFAIVEARLDRVIDKYRAHPMAAAVIPEAQWDELRAEVFARLRHELPKPGGFLYIFTDKAINVYRELSDRMTRLDSQSFEGVLRPAFQKDEWKLIVAGAVLGFGAGILQLVYIFGD